MPTNPFDEAENPFDATEPNPFDAAEPAAPAAPVAPQVAPAPEAPPSNTIDLNKPQPSKFRMSDLRDQAPAHLGVDTWKEQAKASVVEDVRRTRKFLNEDVPAGINKAWDFQADVGNFLLSDDQLEYPLQQSYQDPNNTARQLDQFMQRDPLDLLQAIGHGVFPQGTPFGDIPPAPPGDPSPGIVTAMSSLKDKAFEPAVDAIRYGQEHVGAPIVNAVMDPIEANPTIQNSKMGAAGTLMARQAGSLIGGESAGPNPDSQAAQTLKDSNLMVPALAAGELVRQAPFFLFTSGVGARAVDAEKEAILRSAKLTTPQATAAALEPVLAREAGIEAAAQVGIQTALTPGADVVLGPVSMTLFGHMAGAAVAKPLAQKTVMGMHRAEKAATQSLVTNVWGEVVGRKSALMPAESWEKFLAETEDLARRVQPTKRQGTQGYSTGGLSDRTTKLVMDTATGKVRNSPLVNQGKTKQGATNARRSKGSEPFDTTSAHYARNEDGVLVGREAQVKFDPEKPGQVELTFRDTPLRTKRDVTRFNAMVRKQGVSLGKTRAEGDAMGLLSEGSYEGHGMGTEDYMAPEVAMQVPSVKNKVALKDDLEAIAAERATGATPADKTTPGSRAQGKPVVVVQNVRGVVKPVTVADPAVKAPGTWKLAKGDLVQSPDGMPYIVQGFTAEGKVVAKLPGQRGGRGKTWDNSSLKFVADVEGMTPKKMGPPRRNEEWSQMMADSHASAKPMPSIITDIVKEMGQVTVPRLSKSLGVSPSEAADIIIAHDHLLKPKIGEPGVYEVKQPTGLDTPLRHEPWGELPLEQGEYKGVQYYGRGQGPAKFPPLKLRGHNDPVQWGTEVYFQTSNGRPKKGVVRGPDPARPGHYMMDVYSQGMFEKLEAAGALAKLKLPSGVDVKGLKTGGGYTHSVSLPAKDLYTTVPVNLAKPALTKLFAQRGLYGLTTPHPPNFIVASKSMGKAVNEAVRIAQATRMPVGVKKKYDALMGQLLNAYYLTPPDLRRLSTRLHSAWPAARDAALRISERTKEATGGYGTVPDQDLIQVLEAAHATGQSDDALKDWVFKNPNAVESMRTLRDLLNERKMNSEWMGKRGLSSIDWLEQARGAGEEAEYLTMMYNVDVLKGKYDQWVKKNMPKTWDDAVSELTRGGRNAWEVEDQLASIMRQKDPVGALQESSLVDNTAFKKLKARGDWQAKYPAVAKLMGPVPSGSLRLGHSIGYQRAIKAQLETWDTIADSQWWSPGPRPDLTLPIPNEPRFGRAAGGYTHETLANFVAKKPEEEAGSFARMMGFMGGKWKSFNTVYGGPTPWINNVLRNLKGVAISGALQSPEDLQGFKDAPSLLLGWRENPSMLGPYAVVGEAKQFGAMSAGFAGAEIYDARKRIQDELLRAMSRATGTASSMEDMVMTAQDFMRKHTENIKDAYDAIDQYFKLASYVNLRKRYIAQGMSIHDSAATATEDIRGAYPDFELTAPLVERNRGKWGWVAPFMSSKAEDIRINAMTAARVARTLSPMPDTQFRDPGLVLRMAAFGSTVAGGVGMMRALARSNGITAQDEDDGKNAISLKRQSWSPMLVPMWDFDDKGRLQFIDLTPIEDSFMMLRGNSADPVMARLFLNNLQDFIGEDSYAGRGVQSLMNSAGVISEAPDAPTPIPFGEGGVLGLLGEYARSGGVPQAPIRAYDVMQRMKDNPMNPAAEPLTAAQGAAALMGLPKVIPSGLGTYTSSMLEARGKVRGLKREAKQIPKRLHGDPDQERFDYLLNSKVRGLGAVQQRIGEVKVPKTQSPKGGNK